MDAAVTVVFEHRVYLTKRQLRCAVAGKWSDWHGLTVEEARIVDERRGATDESAAGQALDFPVARACWPGPHVLEGV